MYNDVWRRRKKMSQHLVAERQSRIEQMRRGLRDKVLIQILQNGNDLSKWDGISKKAFIADYCLNEGTRTTRAEEYLGLFIDSGKYYENSGFLKPCVEIINDAIGRAEEVRKRETEEKAKKEKKE